MKVETLFRLIVLVILGCAFLLSGLYRNKKSKEGESAAPQGDGMPSVLLQLLVGFALLAIFILELFFPQLMGWSRMALPFWVRTLGVVLALVCLIWIWWVFRALGDNISGKVPTGESQELIVSGPYRLVRHPLYAGALLGLFSFSLILENWLILVFTVLGVLAFRLLVIPEEEAQLLESFGEEYESYQARTGALLPWIR
ncbi:MAG: isoprenylcysteine carboxylmethyltransferase family protein [Anaerolineales bacterium]|jgi:protein-S-isoprenylcysteine O-methyltransferase Ste14